MNGDYLNRKRFESNRAIRKQTNNNANTNDKRDNTKY